MQVDTHIPKLREYVAKHKDNLQNIQHLTFTSIAQVVGINPYKDHKLLERVIDCAVHRDIITRHFEYIDEEDNCFVLDDENTELFNDTGEFVHPETGEIVCNYTQVYPFFTPVGL